MVRPTLTALIPCKNEAANIEACIRSVANLADELLIADSGSTDRTLSIVQESGLCRVIQRDFVDAGNFKNWAIPQASCEWVLVVDADERVTPALAAEIRQVLNETADGLDGFAVFRNNHFMGHRMRHTSWGRDKVIRLFRRDVGRYLEHTDHSEVDLPPHRIGQLKTRLTHFTCWDYDAYLNKLHYYAEQQARVWYREGRKPSILRMLLNGPLRFARDYVVHGGFLDGSAGLQVSALTGYYSFMKQARLWHKYHAVGPSEVEAA
jgi:glycosyltransferase involved in cell wall biosynthesis